MLAMSDVLYIEDLHVAFESQWVLTTVVAAAARLLRRWEEVQLT